jgi:tetratricopeptide (TPR) repeat protein
VSKSRRSTGRPASRRTQPRAEPAAKPADKQSAKPATNQATATLDRETRDQLEADRDFLLKSLDDLELEHESGGIDNESYAELRDDYTARAAAAIRALRDGVDARPPKPRAPMKRRVAIIAGVLAVAIVAGGALAAALGARLPGQTITGNSQPSSSGAASGSGLTKAQKQQLKTEIITLQTQVNASPDDYDLRLNLADAYARNADLNNAIKQWDAAISIDPNRPEAQALLGRALYLVSEQVSDKQSQAQLVGEAMQAFDKAIQAGPDYADAYYYRGIVNAALQQYAAAQADFQTYIVKAPNGEWSDNAHTLLAQVTTALQSPSTTVPTTTKPPAKKK